MLPPTCFVTPYFTAVSAANYRGTNELHVTTTLQVMAPQPGQSTPSPLLQQVTGDGTTTRTINTISTISVSE